MALARCSGSCKQAHSHAHSKGELAVVQGGSWSAHWLHMSSTCQHIHTFRSSTRCFWLADFSGHKFEASVHSLRHVKPAEYSC
jgi:hypothetical protein